MSIPKFSPQERAIMREALLDVNPEQLKQAQIVATILSDGEESQDDAHLALMFHYSQKENKEELKNISAELMLEN